MRTTRREFVEAGLAAGGLLAVARSARATDRVGPAHRMVPPAPAPLRILVLGGTAFLGPAEVEYAVARGHTVTLFNRGRTDPGRFTDLETLIGDRNDDLTALEGREWDAVIDNSASLPRWVRQSAGLLKDAAQQYLFVSSISVYAEFGTPGMTESAPVATIDDPTVEQITGQTYGALKALCEQEAEAAFPGRATVVRPGLIVGPDDRSDRFTYWPARIDRGGEVLAPGDPTDPTQIVDARDLGEWIVRLVEDRVYGTFHATGPAAPLSMAEMLYGIRAVTDANVSFTWVPADFLAEHQVRPWGDMPSWVPPTGGMEGFARVDCSKAIAAGLTFRPLAVTARDTLDWFKTLPEERRQNLRAGLKPDREAEVLAAWHARAG